MKYNLTAALYGRKTNGKMKLKVTLEADITSSISVIDVEQDLGLSLTDWHQMEYDEQTATIQAYVDELPEQPNWIVDKHKSI